MKLAILQAMRFNVHNEDEAAVVLEQLHAREWDRALPPVVVMYTDAGPRSVPISVPRAVEGVGWTVRLEDGTERSGHVPMAELALLEEREHAGQTFQRRQLPLPERLPWGYHRLSLDQGGGDAVLIVTPGKCWLPDIDDDQRLWGLAANLFSLRSAHNWGIGDFTDLRQLAKLAKERGADVVGLNPLHAMFLDEPEGASPYSPSDRMLLNVLYIDVEAIPELAHAEQARQLIAGAQFQRDVACALGKPRAVHDSGEP